ncbi:MAG: hypothetical protein AAF658_11535 [Myxococcota bacterium]
MRPWELKTAPVEENLSVGDHFEGFDLIFRSQPRFWSAFGRARPSVCQFRVREDGDWHVVIDEDGARVEEGIHTQPDVVWSSSQRGFANAFSGIHLDDDPVEISGEVELLESLLRAISQSP